MIEDSYPDYFLVNETLNLIDENVILDRAENADGALKYLKTNIPNIILLDLNLPKVSGFDLLKILKNDDKYRHIPVVMLTASNNINHIKMAYELYVNSYITKPLDAEIFLKYWKDLVKI